MVEYRRLATEADFDQVSELQRRVFGFSDLEVLPPPLLRTVARKQPPLGLHIGAFQTEGGRSELIGVILGFATFEPGTVYTVLLGVREEHRGMGIGHRLLAEVRREALGMGLTTMYGVYEALDPRLGRFYIGDHGCVGVQLRDGRLLFRWDLALSPDRRRERHPGDVRISLPGAKADQEFCLGRLETLLNQEGFQVIDCETSTMQGEPHTEYVLRPIT